MIKTNLAQAVDATNDAGFSNLGRVKGTMTEDNVLGEGIIYYDIRFTAYHKESEMNILINAQRSTTTPPLFPLRSRKSILTEKVFKSSYTRACLKISEGLSIC